MATTETERIDLGDSFLITEYDDVAQTASRRQEWKPGTGEANRQLMAQRAESALTDLTAALNGIPASGSVTAAQLRPAVLITGRVVVRIARMYLNRLEVAE